MFVEIFLGPLLRCLGPLHVNLLGPLGGIGQDDNPVRPHLEEATGNGQVELFPTPPYEELVKKIGKKKGLKR